MHRFHTALISSARHHCMKLAALAIAIAAVITSASLLSGSTAPSPNDPRAWDWIEGTTWYVKPQGLPAMMYNASTDVAIPSVSQTVYTIRSCRYGYFVGECVIQFGPLQVQCRRLAGTITPEGLVLLTFAEVDPDTGSVVASINAYGTMRRVHGEWTMENQMSNRSTNNADTFALHWAYMFQIDPSDADWNDLPFADMSVPEFMKQCE